MIKIHINTKYSQLKEFIEQLPHRFEEQGKTLFKKRNEIKVIHKDGFDVNVKSFKVPHLVNRVAYAYFRGSKAKHSFEYAQRLIELGVHTPDPIAWIETYKSGLFRHGYYVSLQYNYDFTIRDLIGFDFPDKENILRQFTRFTFEKLHCNGVHHLDYSRGNILIARRDNGYDFSIVDINRMRFERMGYLKGLSNFAQIWAGEKELEIIAREYALLNDKDPDEAVELLIQFDRKHKEHINRKKRFKKNWLKRG